MLRFLLILTIAVTLVACGDDGTFDATGVVVDIESTGFNEVTSFDLRHEGETTTVYVRADFDYSFPIGHLQEHLGGQPVRVIATVEDGRLYADSIEDA